VVGGIAVPVRVERVGDRVRLHVACLEQHPLQREETGVVRGDAPVHLDAVARREDDDLVDPLQVPGVVVGLRQVGIIERQELQELDGRATERDS
jgi:hypothetical protein